MKTGLSWIMVLALGVAIGGAAVRDTYDEIKTVDGVSYKSCTVTKVEPDGLTIIYSDGAVKVPFVKLPASLQQKYHYDPAAAATYQSELEAKKKSQLEAALKASASAAVTETSAPASTPAAKPGAEPVKAAPPVVKYRYDSYEPILRDAESDSIHLTLKPTDAFSLSQLEDAKKKAVEEHKPLGFMMMWDQFYGKKTDLVSKGGASAASHFYYVFRDQLVLVFVRHEDELDKIPDAVKQGFFGPDEGGFAPNMCVTDATAQVYVCEVPLGGGDSNGAIRTKVFRDGFVKIRAAQTKWDEEAAAKAPAAP